MVFICGFRVVSDDVLSAGCFGNCPVCRNWLQMPAEDLSIAAMCQINVVNATFFDKSEKRHVNTIAPVPGMRYIEFYM
jgi:hypothetical protein